MFNIKSLTKYAFVFGVIAPAALHAQTSVTVNATVNAAVTATAGNTTINVGTVNPGATGTLDPVTQFATAASVSVTFNTSTVTFAFPNSVTLTRQTSTETLAATLSCALKQGSNAIAACSSTTFSENADYATSGGVSGTKLATAVIYAGASVSPSATARAGVYTGTFSITVSNSGT
jgi:hypothetical protein